MNGRRMNYIYIIAIATNSFMCVMSYHILQATRYGRELSYVTLI